MMLQLNPAGGNAHPEWGSGGGMDQPSIGLEGFSDKIFSPRGGLTAFGADLKVQQMKRGRSMLRALVGVLVLVVALLGVMLSTREKAQTVAAAQEQESHRNVTATLDRTTLHDLDMSPDADHGVCTASADQSYTVFINGIVIATGSGCDLEFVDKEIDAPPCEDILTDHHVWVAIEAQDSEGSYMKDRSQGGVIASFVWCGLKIYTNQYWTCNDHAPRDWQCPNCPLGAGEVPARWNYTDDLPIGNPNADPGSKEAPEPNRVTGWRYPRVLRESWIPGRPDFPAQHPDKQVNIQDKTGGCGAEAGACPKWIWPGEQGQNIGLNSVYCRRHIRCNDSVSHEYRDQFNATGFPCSDFQDMESMMAGYHHQELEEEITCSMKGQARYELRKAHKGKEPTDAEILAKASEPEGEAKCTPGYFASTSNFLHASFGIFLMMYMFVGFHIVCDDFFVPALNVLCEKLSMPDDVAGATFMAAGASSPELFASLIGVISHSAVGAGTVVGSELFNMLVIIGGVCLVTPIPLALDWRPLVREVTFFTLSLIGILATLQDSQVHWYEAAVLLSGYVGYVLVCSFYPKIIQLFCPMAEGPGGEGDEFRLEAIMDAMDNGDLAVDEGLRDTLRQSMTFSKEKLNGGAFGMDYGDVIMHGFIHKKSEFYSKVRNSKQMWQKRWMVLDDDKLYYQKKNGEDRMLISSPIAWAKAWVRFTDKTEFTVSYPGNELVFQAQVPTLTRKWVAALGSRIEHFRSHAGSPSQIDLVEDAHDDDDDEEVHNILHFPSHGLGAQAFFLFSFPLLLIFRCTIIDVRKKKLMNYFPVTILTTVVWLAVMAEGMMRGADQSGCILGVSESVMGLTVAAAGTSLPNLFASLIVAKQGLGNMSVSNAFGSNTFNIFIALALPWMVGATINGRDLPLAGCPAPEFMYHVPKGKIFTSCLILGAVLIMIVGLLIAFKMMLTKQVGYFFMVTYIIILGYLIAS